MKTITVIGIVLIVLGVVAFIYQGITYTTREKALDIGPSEVTTEQTRTIPLPRSLALSHWRVALH